MQRFLKLEKLHQSASHTFLTHKVPSVVVTPNSWGKLLHNNSLPVLIILSQFKKTNGVWMAKILINSMFIWRAEGCSPQWAPLLKLYIFKLTHTSIYQIYGQLWIADNSLLHEIRLDLQMMAPPPLDLEISFSWNKCDNIIVSDVLDTFLLDHSFLEHSRYVGNVGWRWILAGWNMNRHFSDANSVLGNEI